MYMCFSCLVGVVVIYKEFSRIELFTPYNELERGIRSLRETLKTLSLDELRCQDFKYFDQDTRKKKKRKKNEGNNWEQYMRKEEVILFYNGLNTPTRQILDSRGVIPTMTAEDAKQAIQEMAEYSQKWYNGTSRGRSIETSDGLAAIQAQLNNLGREIKKVNEKVYAA
ncbi:hypothetical protein Tco_0725313 [Tanacetum coccineum]|uniref:Uncharacterized protein n=1 Tax=Tanacetum coccineum TaxID=301880 RepID=A0ABQ4YEZ6_9ASTR